MTASSRLLVPTARQTVTARLATPGSSARANALVFAAFFLIVLLASRTALVMQFHKGGSSVMPSALGRVIQMLAPPASRIVIRLVEVVISARSSVPGLVMERGVLSASGTVLATCKVKEGPFAMVSAPMHVAPMALKKSVLIVNVQEEQDKEQECVLEIGGWTRKLHCVRESK